MIDLRHTHGKLHTAPPGTPSSPVESLSGTALLMIFAIEIHQIDRKFNMSEFRMTYCCLTCLRCQLSLRELACLDKSQHLCKALIAVLRYLCSIDWVRLATERRPRSNYRLSLSHYFDWLMRNVRANRRCSQSNSGDHRPESRKLEEAAFAELECHHGCSMLKPGAPKIVALLIESRVCGTYAVSCTLAYVGFYHLVDFHVM